MRPVAVAVLGRGVVDPDTPVLTADDAALARGLAAFETVRVYGGRIFALDEHLDRIQQLVWPNLIILGGGVSKSADKFIPRLTVKCEVVAAELRNDAGIIGAAVVAAESRVEDAEGVSITLEPARNTREAKT